MKKDKRLWLWVFIPLLALTISLILEKITIQLFVSISGLWLIIFFLYMVDLETISEIKVGVASVKRDVKAAREIREEIEGILESIKLQKERLDIIVEDANKAQMQISQIEIIANQAHIKSQEIDGILKDAKSEETTRKLKRLSALGHE